MTHDTIELYYNLSLYIGLPLGSLVLFFWGLFVYKHLLHILEKYRLPVSITTLIYMLPGLFLMIIVCIPVIYFNHLNGQYDYCRQVVEVNEGIQKDDPIFEERCSAFDIDELFESTSESTNE